MSKRRSIKVVGDNGAKVAKADKEGEEDDEEDDEEEIDWELCFICQTEESEKLQSSSDARSTSGNQAYNDLAHRIIKFHSMNLLPVQLKMNKLRGTLKLGDSLIRHAAKFHKSCKLKFGMEKLEKAKKKFKKQKESEKRGNH